VKREGSTIAWLTTLLVLSGAIFAAWPVHADSAPSLKVDAAAPIKIGFIASLTGTGAKDGPDMVKGIKLYLEQIHYKIGNHKVELHVEDDESSILMAIAKAKKLVSKDKVDVLAGVIFSPFAYAVAPVADESHTPFLVSTSTADDLTQRKRRKWVLRICSTSSQISQPLGEYAAKRLHLKKIVTVGCNYAHPFEVVAGFHKTFEDNGGKIIQKLWLPMDAVDFTEALSTIRPDADAVFLALVGEPCRLVPAQLHKLRPHLVILASSATLEENILQDIGPYVDGAISSNNHSEVLNNATNRRFIADYRAAYGSLPSTYARGAYTAGAWIHQAVDALHGNIGNREELLSALKRVELKESINGPIRLDSFGGLIENIYIRKVEKVGGKYQNSIIQVYPHVSQFWNAKPDNFLKNPVFGKDYPPCIHCAIEPKLNANNHP